MLFFVVFDVNNTFCSGLLQFFVKGHGGVHMDAAAGAGRMAAKTCGPNRRAFDFLGPVVIEILGFCFPGELTYFSTI